MGDIILLYCLQHICILCIIFWLLTWNSEHFNKKKFQYFTSQIYECGFNSLSELNIQINLNFSMLCIFLILYDMEFLFFFPIFFNIFEVLLINIFIFIFFLISIFLTLIYDWQCNSLNWSY